MMPVTVTLEEMLVRMLSACGLAFVIGLDREIRNKPIGMRTFMLVALGAAAFSLVVLELHEGLDHDPGMALDPSRVMQGIIGGIGFLGAGAIIQGDRRVIGATTGASIWVVGGIGIACGFGFYVHAGMITGIAAVVLSGLRLVEHYLFKHH